MPSRAKAIDWPQEETDRRATPRFRVADMLALLESDLFLDPVRVTSIGKLGFAARSFIEYPTSTRVHLHLEGYELLPARIVWCTRGQLGARFEQPLDEMLLLNLILGAEPPNPVQKDKAPAALPVLLTH